LEHKRRTSEFAELKDDFQGKFGAVIDFVFIQLVDEGIEESVGD